MATHWTPEEVKYLRENRTLKTYAEIGEAIGKSYRSVMQKVNRLNLNGKRKAKAAAAPIQRPPAVYDNKGYLYLLKKYEL